VVHKHTYDFIKTSSLEVLRFRLIMQCSSLDDLVLYQKIMEYSLAPVGDFTKGEEICYKNPHMQQEKKLYILTRLFVALQTRMKMIGCSLNNLVLLSLERSLIRLILVCVCMYAKKRKNGYTLNS